MKTAVQMTSVEAYYQAIVAPGVELADAHVLMVHVLQHWPCTRREISEHFRKIDPRHRFAQEARVSARINWLLNLRVDNKPVLSQGDPIRDATGHLAHPLYPVGKGLQRDLFSTSIPQLSEAAA